ncbi:MAG TPA: shikimate kinase [Rhodothermales bacterium]|nr:shikimate kinase [Rhodothermales bacterium]
MPTLIYLIGFMGSGKSTLGSILANVLGYDFMDLDDVLVTRFRRSIEAVFTEEGEDAFRAAEQALVRESTMMEETVISTGGGAFLFAENRSLMSQHGLTVYLRLPLSLLVDRLRSSRHRPLLYDDRGVTLTGAALETRIGHLLEEREPFYEMADLVIDVEPGSVGQTVDTLFKEIQAFAKKPA